MAASGPRSATPSLRTTSSTRACSTTIRRAIRPAPSPVKYHFSRRKQETIAGMNVGVFTPLLSQLPLPAVLDKLRTLNITTVELGTGNYPGDAHCKLSMLDNPASLAEFQKVLADHGVTISALSCHGNPLHPDSARARHDAEVSRKTILLAEKL